MSETRAEYTMQTTVLTAAECLRFETLETQIQDNLFAFRQVAAALIEIHDKKLYRQKYSSFENYLKLRWGPMNGDMSRMRAWQLMESERTIQAIEAENVNNGLQNPIPQNESQTRPLNKLPLEDRPRAYALAVEENDGKIPSGSQVADVVHRLDFVDTDPDPQPPPPSYEPPNYQTTAESHIKSEQFRSDTPKKAFGYLCDIVTDPKHRAIWLTFVSPANPATGKKEYKTKNLRIPFRDLIAQGWTPPQGESEEEEDSDDEFSQTSDGVREYAERQMAKARANLEKETIADKAQNAFWGKAEPEEDALPGSFLTPEQAENMFSEAGI